MSTRESNYDWSTINQDELKKRPVFKCPPSYHLGSMGCGCAGDPPGFPSYFLQTVYNQHENTPSRGATCVLFCKETGAYHIVEKAGEYFDSEKRDALLRKLWKPLPLSHERVQLWIQNKARHNHHCYWDDSKSGHDAVTVYPASWASEESNQQSAKIAVPENLLAYRSTHKFYTEVTPAMIQEAEKAEGGIQLWWERLAERPAPERCPGESFQAHPVNSTWCQVCGWHAA